MTDQFNPHHEWLGLDRQLRQPNYYELLGIRESEQDAAAISGAAVAALTRVRRVKPGPRAAQLVRLFEEILAAKKCLSDPPKRAAYDQGLRGFRPAAATAPRRPAPRTKLAPLPVPIAAVAVPVVPMATPNAVVTLPPELTGELPAPRFQPAAAGLNTDEPLAVAWPCRPKSTCGRRRPHAVAVRKRSRAAQGLALPISIASVLVVALVGILLAALIGNSNAQTNRPSAPIIRATN
ncbi:MAG: hypothetical protein NTY19_13820 [Planctomycetota bacterium]|nr:hypothetical protein [Planctomycetota bacterium]